MSDLPAAIIFDLDGTLIDSMPDVRRALNVTLAEDGRPPLTLEQVRLLVGHGARPMIEGALRLTGGLATDADIDGFRARYLAHYAADPVACTEVYPGVRQVLDDLRAAGVVLGICSNKPSIMVGKVLDALGMVPLFAGITGGDDVERGKPHADHLRETLRRMRVGAERVVMVGDSGTDVAAARNAGMPVVVVEFGYCERPATQLGADAVIGHFDQLLPVLARLVSQGSLGYTSEPSSFGWSAMTRVAVASRSFSRHPVLRAELLSRYATVTFNDAGQSLSGDELVAFLSGHDKAITALEILDESVLSRLPDLKVVGKYGVGLDMIDLAAMSRLGKKLGWIGGVNKRSVSELVIAFAIALLRHIPQGNALIRDGDWRQLMGRQLSERTVGIIGCGHIGKDLSRLLKAFGCRVLVHDIRDFPEFYAETGVEKMALESLLAEADIVTLHLPFDVSTRNILSAERLALMHPGSILINAARGGLVDEAALRAMLEAGKLAGAAFDVFATEPPEDRALIDLPNFLCTPHVGGSAEEAVLAMGRAAITGLDEACDPLKFASQG